MGEELCVCVFVCLQQDLLLWYLWLGTYPVCPIYVVLFPGDGFESCGCLEELSSCGAVVGGPVVFGGGGEFLVRVVSGLPPG